MTGLAEQVGLTQDDVAAVVDGLGRRELTAAAAESLTGGLLLACLTEIPGASAVVRGGLVVYATDLKHVLAGVGTRLLAEHGPVHPEVALALARGARERCRASVGIGLTGVAGPDDQDGVPVGTWYVAVVHPDGVIERAGGGPPAETGGAAPTRRVRDARAAIRSAAVRAAVGALADVAGVLVRSPDA